MIYALGKKPKHIKSKTELQQNIDKILSYSKDYISIVNTSNNAVIYRDNDKLIKEINDKPVKNHKSFMDIFNKQYRANDKYKIEKLSIYFSIELDQVLYSNILKKLNENDGNMEVGINISDELLINILTETDASIEKLNEEVAYVNDIKPFNELEMSKRDYINWLFIEKGMTEKTLLSVSHVDRNGNIDIYSVIKE